MRRKRQARLEMTSLMDVMFLVLVFFIYCIFDMTVHHGVPVALPEAVGAIDRTERTVVTVAADGTYALDGETLPRAEVVARVRAQRAENAARAVLIAGDRAAPLGSGIELLADLKAAGVTEVGFQVSGKK